MALEISLTHVTKPGDQRRRYTAYSLMIGNHRVLAVATDCTTVLSSWLHGVLKSRRRHSTTIVGVSAAHDDLFSRSYSPLNLLSLSLSSDCLHFLLPSPDGSSADFGSAAKHLSAFFKKPSIVAVASDALALSSALKNLHGVTFRRLLDVREDVAAKGLVGRRIGAAAVDVGGFSLDEVAAAVFGKRVVAERPERGEKVKMCLRRDMHGSPPVLSDERIKLSSLDSHLCFSIASEFADEIAGGFCGGFKNREVKATKVYYSISSSAKKSAKKKKKKKMRKELKEKVKMDVREYYDDLDAMESDDQDFEDDYQD